MKTTISIAIIFLMSLSSQAQTLIPKVGISLSALGASEHVPMMSIVLVANRATVSVLAIAFPLSQMVALYSLFNQKFHLCKKDLR
jgi:hypothetical protein